MKPSYKTILDRPFPAFTESMPLFEWDVCEFFGDLDKASQSPHDIVAHGSFYDKCGQRKECVLLRDDTVAFTNVQDAARFGKHHIRFEPLNS